MLSYLSITENTDVIFYAKQVGGGGGGGQSV